MKTTFALTWIRSIQPRKQRKFRMNAPYHIQGNFLSAPLSKELRKKHNTKSIRVRTGDKVTVTRGQFKGTTGTVSRVDVSRAKVFVSGVELTKKEGGKVPYPLDASKLMITSLTQDKRRFQTTEA